MAPLFSFPSPVTSEIVRSALSGLATRSQIWSRICACIVLSTPTSLSFSFGLYLGGPSCAYAAAGGCGVPAVGEGEAPAAGEKVGAAAES